MISKDSLIKTFKKLQGVDTLANIFITDVIKVIKEQPEADPWIMCSDRMPEERKLSHGNRYQNHLRRKEHYERNQNRSNRQHF